MADEREHLCLGAHVRNTVAMTGLAVIVLLAAGPVVLMYLTSLGAHARGMRWVPACLVGLVFPVTWAVWYAHDELPRRSRASQSAAH